MKCKCGFELPPVGSSLVYAVRCRECGTVYEVKDGVIDPVPAGRAPSGRWARKFRCGDRYFADRYCSQCGAVVAYNRACLGEGYEDGCMFCSPANWWPGWAEEVRDG